jgi:hypothetical protein
MSYNDYLDYYSSKYKVNPKDILFASYDTGVK